MLHAVRRPRVRGSGTRVLATILVVAGTIAVVAAHGQLARANGAAVAGSLVVNEIDYDQPGADDAEFVEIKNVTDSPVFLGDFDVVGINGLTTPGTEYLRIQLPNVTLGSGDYFVVGAAGVANVDLTHATGFIQNGAPDAMAVVESVPSAPANDDLVDSLSYEGDTAGGPATGGSWTEGTGSGLDDSGATANQGLSRVPDGVDTNANNLDVARACITPGEANTSGATGCAPSGGTDPAPSTTPTTAPPTTVATATSEPATATFEPPTATLEPATATSEPPTATSAPATATVLPPPTMPPSPTATALPSSTPTTPPSATATPTTAIPSETNEPSPSSSPDATETPASGPPTVTATPPPTSASGPPTQDAPATATPPAMAVQLAWVRATRMSRGVQISWQTISEIEHAGFHVVRQVGGSAARLTSRPIRPRGGVLGAARYHLLDDESPPPAAFYWLIDLDTKGHATWHGPVRVRAYKHFAQPGADQPYGGWR